LTFNKINQSTSGVESKIESVDVLKFSEALKDLTRKQDCVARLGINECVILVKESKSNVENLLTRLATSKELTVENTLQISATTVELEDGEKALALLNRLDLVLPHSD
jgi:GGDEF domain-containing protein